MTDQSMIWKATVYRDGRITTVAVTCTPSDALLRRVLALVGRREMTIRAPMAYHRANIRDLGQALLDDVTDGKVEPSEVEIIVDTTSPPRTLHWSGFRSRKPATPLMRWAAIKPGQPWRLVP